MTAKEANRLNLKVLTLTDCEILYRRFNLVAICRDGNLAGFTEEDEDRKSQG